MALAKCPRCDKMFNKGKSNICPKCQPDEDADYEKLRTALEESPNQTPEQLVEATDVDLECVMRLLEDGRIATAPSERGGIRCGRCGAPAISMSKKLCEGCLQKLNSEVARAQAKIKLPKKRQTEVGTAMNIRKWIDEDS